MLARLRKFLTSEAGATAVEYALVVSLILLAMLTGLGTAGQETLGFWADIATAVAGG